MEPDDAEPVARGIQVGDTQAFDVARPFVDAVAVPARRPDRADDPTQRDQPAAEHDRCETGHRLVGFAADDPLGTAAMPSGAALCDRADVTSRAPCCYAPDQEPPAAPRSTNRPKPRSPTKAPSRMTGRPRTITERTAPVSSKPSYGV